MNRERLYQEILTKYGASEMERVRILIGSRTLREALRLIVDAQAGVAELFIPHYWAQYYHDGRAGFGPILASKLIFYADARDDPRVQGGYPVRDTDIIQLTGDQYRTGLKRNAERRAAGQSPFMFVVDSVGPAGAHPFFDQLAQNASNRAELVVRHAFDAEVQKLVDEDPDVRAERDVAEFFL